MGKDRILVVDDDPDNRAMIGHFLSNWGYDVDDTKNGKVALEKVAAHPPQLVLLDLEMPEMDGFETCEHLKTDPETEWIPVIIFTGLEKMPQRVRGFRHGADDYVVKTITVGVLRLDNTPDQKDDAFDLVPLRGNELAVTEPFELSAGEWSLLSHVDGQKDLASIREAMNVAPAGFMKAIRTLKDKGFIKLASRDRKSRKGA